MLRDEPAWCCVPQRLLLTDSGHPAAAIVVVSFLVPYYNRGGINGWVRDGAIYGIATKIEG